jgi:hypothetical protein
MGSVVGCLRRRGLGNFIEPFAGDGLNGLLTRLIDSDIVVDIISGTSADGVTYSGCGETLSVIERPVWRISLVFDLSLSCGLTMNLEQDPVVDCKGCSVWQEID